MIRMSPGDLWWLGTSLVRAVVRGVRKFYKIYKIYREG